MDITEDMEELYMNELEVLLDKEIIGFKQNVTIPEEFHPMQPIADLAFECKDGEILYFEAEGECCSKSWIESIEDFNAFPGTVKECLAVEGPGFREHHKSEFKNYFFKIKTDKGYFDIEMRNESNGYYGGNLNQIKKYVPRAETADSRKDNGGVTSTIDILSTNYLAAVTAQVKENIKFYQMMDNMDTVAGLPETSKGTKPPPPNEDPFAALVRGNMCKPFDPTFQLIGYGKDGLPIYDDTLKVK